MEYFTKIQQLHIKSRKITHIMKHRKFNYENNEIKKNRIKTDSEIWNIITLSMFDDLTKFILFNNRVISINLILLTSDNKIVLCERSLSFGDTEIDPDKKHLHVKKSKEYILPGGHLDKRVDDTMIDCILRETKEECKINKEFIYIFEKYLAYSSVYDIKIKAYFHNFTFLGISDLSSDQISQNFNPTKEIKALHFIDADKNIPGRLGVFLLIKKNIIENITGMSEVLQYDDSDS